MPIAKGDAATSALLFFAIDDEWAREEGKEAAVNRALERRIAFKQQLTYPSSTKIFQI